MLLCALVGFRGILRSWAVQGVPTSAVSDVASSPCSCSFIHLSPHRHALLSSGCWAPGSHGLCPGPSGSRAGNGPADPEPLLVSQSEPQLSLWPVGSGKLAWSIQSLACPAL